MLAFKLECVLKNQAVECGIRSLPLPVLYLLTSERELHTHCLRKPSFVLYPRLHPL